MRAPGSAGLLAWLLALVLALACRQPTTWPEADGFDDHTVGRVNDVEHFRSLAASDERGTLALKFVILAFADKGETLRLLDSNFYGMHDEWYWFRLFNGQRVPGARDQPRQDTAFNTVAEAQAWARAQRTLPYGMRWVEDRLYSDYFYELAIHRDQRVFGIGTLLHLPARTQEPARPARWAFELEYSDDVSEVELARFFAILREHLPEPISSELSFIARSPLQERLVADLRGREHALAPRLATYAELAVPGEVEVYNPGLIAGRLRKVPRDSEQAAAMLSRPDEDAILLMAAVPDELPTARGLITATPQTPLAHVNLLARNRGIPNAYYGGSYDDPQFDQLSRVHAPVVVLAEADGLRIEPISEDEYARYLALIRKPQPKLQRVEVGSLPWTIEIESRTIAEMPELRPIIGGKAAGFLALFESSAGLPALHRPTPALAITVRAYAEHMVDLRPRIRDLLLDGRFVTDARARLLLLEGHQAFAKHYGSKADGRWLEEFESQHPKKEAERDAVAFFLERDGVKKAIRERALDRAIAEPIERSLLQTFAGLAPTQGLRFRSSSSVEDIEGFNGAGLYESNTGFANPAAQADESDRKHDFEWALKKTWASYWSFPAFEERRLAGIDHLSGNMGVLVHPRFDDEREDANGVVTMTWTPARDGVAESTSMLINVQAGELSVANPPTGTKLVRPELIRVTREPSGTHIERLASSTEVPAGAEVLDDARIHELLAVCERIAARWHAVENANLPPTRKRFANTLDLEFRVVSPGWPARADGVVEPGRLVVKQVRSLEPGLPPGAANSIDQPIPRDLLSRASRIDRWQCAGSRARVDLIEVLVDPIAAADRRLPADPFVARLRVDGRGPIPDLEFSHLDLATVTHPNFGGRQPWALSVSPKDEIRRSSGIERLTLEAGLLRIIAADGSILIEEPAPCTRQTLLDSPIAFLRDLLERRPK